MKGIKVLAMHALLISALGGAGVVTQVGAQSDLQQLAHDNTAFAMRLYGELAAGEGNLIFSPYSLSTALAMTAAGARGTTEKQMAEVLNFTLARDELPPAFGKLDAQIRAAEGEGLRLLTANSLWPHKGYPFLDDYLTLIKRHYGATINALDYMQERELARVTINRWVEEKTADKITDLLKQSDLSPLVRMVLVNAIYFKGAWATPFTADETSMAPFHLSPAATVEVPMMRQKLRCRHAALEQLDILELPYSGGKMSFVVLLPKEIDGLSKLEKQLTAANLAAWQAQMSSHEVQVFLPKFKTTFRFDLSQTLADMGMSDAFSDRADFSGMDGRTDTLYLSAVIHQALVEINEEGTEAAAATAGVMMLRAMPTPPPIFRADHPFIFMVYERQTGSIIFMGRFAVAG